MKQSALVEEVGIVVVEEVVAEVSLAMEEEPEVGLLEVEVVSRDTLQRKGGKGTELVMTMEAVVEVVEPHLVIVHLLVALEVEAVLDQDTVLPQVA